MQTDLCVCALPAYKHTALRRLVPALGKRHAVWKERLDAYFVRVLRGKTANAGECLHEPAAHIAPEMMVERGHLIALRLEFLPERCCAAHNPVAIRRKIRSCDHMQRQRTLPIRRKHMEQHSPAKHADIHAFSVSLNDLHQPRKRLCAFRFLEHMEIQRHRL